MKMNTCTLSYSSILKRKSGKCQSNTSGKWAASPGFFENYKAKYLKAPNSIRENSGQFIADTNAILYAISKRVEKEEHELFPLVGQGVIAGAFFSRLPYWLARNYCFLAFAGCRPLQKKTRFNNPGGNSGGADILVFRLNALFRYVLYFLPLLLAGFSLGYALSENNLGLAFSYSICSAHSLAGRKCNKPEPGVSALSQGSGVSAFRLLFPYL
jgi:hypothetical protein